MAAKTPIVMTIWNEYLDHVIQSVTVAAYYCVMDCATNGVMDSARSAQSWRRFELAPWNGPTAVVKSLHLAMDQLHCRHHHEHVSREHDLRAVTSMQTLDFFGARIQENASFQQGV
jgi:hypothetical protein